MADHHDHGAGMPPMPYGGPPRMGFPPGGGWQQQPPAGLPGAYGYVPVAGGGMMPGMGMPRGPPVYGGAAAGAGSSSSAAAAKGGAGAAAAAAAVNRGKWTVEEVRTAAVSVSSGGKGARWARCRCSPCKEGLYAALFCWGTRLLPHRSTVARTAVS